MNVTLKEIIENRSHKTQREYVHTMTDYWQGYYAGWDNAYKDLKEILEYNKINLEDIIVIKAHE